MSLEEVLFGNGIHVKTRGAVLKLLKCFYHQDMVKTLKPKTNKHFSIQPSPERIFVVNASCLLTELQQV